MTVELHHEAAGTGPAVVLLHSSIGDSRMWDPQWPELVAHFRAVRCDLRGHGLTPLASGPYNDAEDVIGLLDALGVGQAALVGASFGGRVALEVATVAPERVERLALLCPNYRGLPPTETAQHFEAEEENFLERGDLDEAADLNVRTWVGPYASAETRAKVAMMQRKAFELHMAAWDSAVPPQPAAIDITPEKIGAPTLVVSGGRDMDHFQNIAGHLVARLPHARHLRLPWAGHLPSLERPSEVTALLLGFLSTPIPA